MNRRSEPPVVAELGRPETPDETANRKAEASRAHRANQTLLNLALALAASLAVVVIAILVVVRPDPPVPPPVDYRTIAAESGAPNPLAVPDLPADWKSNSAVYDAHPPDGVATWYIGFITPKQEFLGLRQGVGANPTWLANQVKGRASTGTTTVDGVEWSVYDRRGDANAGNFVYALASEGGSSDIVLFGTAGQDEFEKVAASLSRYLTNDRTGG